MEKNRDDKIELNNKSVLIIFVIILAISIIIISNLSDTNKKSTANNNATNLDETSVIKEKSTLNTDSGSTSNAIVTSQQSNLALQEKCAEDAHKSFIHGGYSTNSDTYQNHYNKKLDVCFIVISTAQDDGIMQVLGDANTNQEYGDYMYIFSSKSAFISDCTQDGKPNANCRIINASPTVNDWQNFIQPYMQN